MNVKIRVMETQVQGSGQAAGKATGEFEGKKGSLSGIESWGLAPSEEIGIKITQKATQAQAEIFAKCNKPGV